MNSSLINSFIVLWFHFIWLKLNFNFNEHSYLIISFTLDLPWRENYAPLSLFSWSHIQSEEKITSSPYFRNTKNKILHMAANTVHNVKTFFKKISIFDFFFGRGFCLCQSIGLNENFLHILFCVVIKEIWQHAKYMFLLRASK